MNEDDSGFDIILGGVDNRTDFTHMGLSDLELAERLQAEEFNPEPSNVEDYDVRGYDAPVRYRDLESKTREVYEDTQSKSIQHQREEIDRLKKEAELHDKRMRDMRQKEAEMRDKHMRDMRQKELNALKRENELIRQKNMRNSYDLGMYKNLYDWGLGIAPSYYSYLQKKKLEDVLSKLIKSELLLSTPKYEVQNMIQKVVDDINTSDDFTLKKTTKPRTARKKSKKTSRKTNRKKSKKTSRKKSRKTSRKTNRKK